MIKEAYCSYEVSKLLKEKGFDGEIHTTYDDEGYTQPSITHQMACAWLREEKDIIIVIEPHTYDYPNEKTSSYVFAIWEGDNYIETYSNSKLHGISYLTYEDAVEAAIKYSLENLL